MPPYLRLVVDGAEAVEELEGCENFALDEYGGNDGRSCPVAGTWRHLKEPLLQRKLANLAHSAVTASQQRGHDPRYELEEREERSMEVVQELGGLEDAVDGTEDALAQDGRA